MTKGVKSKTRVNNNTKLLTNYQNQLTKDQISKMEAKEKLIEALSLERWGKGKDNDRLIKLFDEAYDDGYKAGYESCQK